MAMKACPYRSDFYAKLGSPLDVVLEQMRAWVTALENIVKQIQAFIEPYASKHCHTKLVWISLCTDISCPACRGSVNTQDVDPPLYPREGCPVNSIYTYTTAFRFRMTKVNCCTFLVCMFKVPEDLLGQHPREQELVSQKWH